MVGMGRNDQPVCPCSYSNKFDRKRYICHKVNSFMELLWLLKEKLAF